MPQIVITLTDDGKFNITGPLENKILAYGMLGTAWEVVSKTVPGSKIVHPAGIMMPPPPGDNRS